MAESDFSKLDKRIKALEDKFIIKEKKTKEKQ